MTATVRPRTWSIRAVIVAASIAAVLTACGTGTRPERATAPATIRTPDDGYAGTLVADPPLRPADVVLRDTRGKPYPLKGVGRDHVTALFFGFTHCDDICPTTMADLAAARRVLPAPLASRVEVVFVTVDPRRDTPRALDRWLGRFDPDIVGLRGPLARVHRAEDSLYSMRSMVMPSKREHHAHSGHTASSGGGYQVSHSGSVYVFGPDGTSLLYTGGATASEYAGDFTRLLNSS